MSYQEPFALEGAPSWPARSPSSPRPSRCSPGRAPPLPLPLLSPPPSLLLSLTSGVVLLPLLELPSTLGPPSTHPLQTSHLGTPEFTQSRLSEAALNLHPMGLYFQTPRCSMGFSS